MNQISAIRCAYVLLAWTLTSCAIQDLNPSPSSARSYPEGSLLYAQAHDDAAYAPIEQQAHVVTHGNDQVAYFAAKGELALMGSDEVARGDNELFFYGFCAPNETLAQFLTKRLPQEVEQLDCIPRHNYTDDLSATMKKLMVSFYAEQNEVSARDVASQDVLISFLHLIDNKVNAYVLHCIDGEFKRINDDAYIKLEQGQNKHSLCIAMLTSMQSANPLSPVYDLVKQNDITRQAMLARPAELVQQIMETDKNEHIKGMTLFSIHKWLARCVCPATTPEYASLKNKWDKAREGAAVLPSTEAEKQILQYAKTSDRSALLILAAQLRAKNASAPVAAFLDDMIEDHQEEDVSLFTRLCNVFN